MRVKRAKDVMVRPTSTAANRGRPKFEGPDERHERALFYSAKRINVAIDAFRRLGNLANTKLYHLTNADILRIKAVLRQKQIELEAKLDVHRQQTLKLQRPEAVGEKFSWGN